MRFLSGTYTGRPVQAKTVRFRLGARDEDKWWWKLYRVRAPDDKFVARWRGVCIVFLAITLFRLPIYIAFSGTTTWATFVINDAYFLADNILALNTGFMHKGKPVMERRQILDRYFRWDTFTRGDRWSFWVFVIEFVPFYVANMIVESMDWPEWIISIAALPRTRRLWDLLSYWKDLEVGMVWHPYPCAACPPKLTFALHTCCEGPRVPLWPSESCYASVCLANTQLNTDSEHLRTLAVIKYALVLTGSANFFACMWWAIARFSG
jgi:hypothetical protein